MFFPLARNAHREVSKPSSSPYHSASRAKELNMVWRRQNSSIVACLHLAKITRCVHACSKIGSYKYKIAITIIAITMEDARKGALAILMGTGPARDRLLREIYIKKGAGPSRRTRGHRNFELCVRPLQVRSVENKRF